MKSIKDVLEALKKQGITPNDLRAHMLGVLKEADRADVREMAAEDAEKFLLKSLAKRGYKQKLGDAMVRIVMGHMLGKVDVTNLAKMMERMASGRQAAKYNQRDYTFYVLVNGKIESGWEYKEDAQDQLGELPPGQKGKVLTKTGVQRQGLDPDDNANWLTNKQASEGTMDEQAIAERVARSMESAADPYDAVYDAIMQDSDGIVTLFERDVKALEDALREAKKQIAGLDRLGSGRISAPDIMRAIVMPAVKQLAEDGKRVHKQAEDMVAKAK